MNLNIEEYICRQYIENNISMNEFITCSYCNESIENNLNSYISHIIEKNHIVNNMNNNIYYINRLLNFNIDEGDEEDEGDDEGDNDDEEEGVNNVLYQSNRNIINIENFQNISQLYKFIISNLSELELSILNELLVSENFGEYDPQNDDINDSQECLELIKVCLIDFNYLDINGNLINSNRLNQDTLQEIFYVNGVNRFNDNDFEDLIENQGLDLNIYSTKYKITTDVECAVCLDVFKDGNEFNKMHCNHEFCSKCANQWFSKNNKCPLCNVNLKKK